LCQASFAELHRDYELIFFSASERREFVRHTGDGFLELYDFYPTEAHQEELFALIYVFSSGGFYFHTDVFAHSRLDPLLCYALVLTEAEAPKAPGMWQASSGDAAEQATQIGEYGFASEAGHWFLDEAISEMANRAACLEDANPVFRASGYTRCADVFSFVYETRKPRFGDADCLLQGSDRGRWGEFGAYATHILSNEV